MQKLAHELKTPISAIVAAAEVMRDERLGPIGDARYRGYAADIHESARLMLDVIDRMLAHRTAEPAASQLEIAEFDTSALVVATANSISSLAERQGITLEVEVEASLPHLVADAMSLRQMIMNLLTNALKFTPEGGTVTVSGKLDSDGRVVITVADTGRGMEPAEIERALAGAPGAGAVAPPGQVTERGAGGGLAAGGGLGLGLPLVKALAALNGAHLDIASDGVSGTSVHITFDTERAVPL
ncbi:MAG: ATP-binding protein [Hyphomicrobiaceae bacterium]|nr:ATP-binding protein [Hyphomicrobiaceae bacterium]